MALDVIINWEIADAVSLSGNQHISLSQKWFFSSFPVLINCLGSQLRTEGNASYESWTKLYDPGRLYQVSSLTKPRWVENTAFTVDIS